MYSDTMSVHECPTPPFCFASFPLPYTTTFPPLRRRSHLIRHGRVEAEDVAEALDELQGGVGELSRRPRLVREGVGAASAVLLDGRDGLQNLFFF